MFVAGEATNLAFNEFQRVDVAPYETRGDGRLTAADFQLVRNYVATLVAPQAAGGPTEPVPVEPAGERFIEDRGGRVLRVGVRQAVSLSRRTNSPSYHVRAGGKAEVSVEFEPMGDETVVLFSLRFDPSVLANPVLRPGEKMPEGITLTANTDRASDGIIRVLVDSSGPLTKGESVGLVNISFDVRKDAPAGPTSISFAGPGSMADAESRSLEAEYVDGAVIVAPRDRVASGIWLAPFLPSRGILGETSFFAFPFGVKPAW